MTFYKPRDVYVECLKMRAEQFIGNEHSCAVGGRGRLHKIESSSAPAIKLIGLSPLMSVDVHKRRSSQADRSQKPLSLSVINAAVSSNFQRGKDLIVGNLSLLRASSHFKRVRKRGEFDVKKYSRCNWA